MFRWSARSPGRRSRIAGRALSALGWSLALGAVLPGTGAAQDTVGTALRPVTRADAVRIALERGIAGAIGRADTDAARAQLRIARAFPNPALAASYTKSVPQLHATVDFPLDLPYLRGLRVGGARAALDAARLQFAYVQATVRYDVDTAYGGALAAAERAHLSGQSARDADSLLTIARRQRDAGYASDLDVDLAAINAGQQVNVAATDSLAAVTALLALQNLMALPSDRPLISLAESLDDLIAAAGAVFSDSALAADAGRPPPAGAGGPAAAGSRFVPLPVAAAAATFQSQDLALRLARRRGALVPAIQLGVEGRDPTGADKGVLPVVGLSFPLPLFNRFHGEIALAEAGRLRAGAQLEAARRTADAAIATARRQVTQASTRLARERALLVTARVVARKALIAYQEGASALPAVLQAQQTARAVLAQYVSDAVAVSNAAAAVRLSTTSP